MEQVLVLQILLVVFCPGRDKKQTEHLPGLIPAIGLWLALTARSVTPTCLAWGKDSYLPR